jgi:vancomycin resistance protein YoaR
MNSKFLLGLLLFFHTVVTPSNFFSTIKSQPSQQNAKEQDLLWKSPSLPVIDTKEFNKVMDELDSQVYIAPKDALINPYGNIVPEKVGYRLHRVKFIRQMYAHYFNDTSSKQELPLQVIYPKVDSELLDSIRRKKIGRYVTSFNSNNKERSMNISLATEAINNSVIFPKEQFSFNQIVGKRTVEKGYLQAPVIINGKFSEDIGGGICQVSSTLFNAVDNAGLKIVQRYSHSRKIPYVPPKRDATVSWDGPDFVFENTYERPVLIRAKMLGNHLLIEIYSAETISYQPRNVPYL